MRRIIAAVVGAAIVLAVAATPGMAQKRPGGDSKPAAKGKTAVDDKAYKAALDKIPEPKGKVDPWGAMRPADAPKTPR